MNCKPTGTTNLYRDIDTGIYYARTSGVWRTLDTDAKTTALERLPAKLIAIRNEKDQGFKLNTSATVGSLITEFIASKTELQRIGKISANTVRNLNRAQTQITEFWGAWGKGLLATAAKNVDAKDLAKRHNDLHGKYSATTVNGIKALLFGAFQIAVDNKTLIHNPASQMNAKTPAPETKEVPTDEQLILLFGYLTQRAAVRYAKRVRLEAGIDLIKFLCSFGCRIDEAAHVLKSHVNLANNTVYFAKTKNGKPRAVPFDAETRVLIVKLLELESGRSLDYKDRAGRQHKGEALLRAKNIHKTLTAACEKLNIPHLTHHTFRHLFASKHLMATCDYFAVANWLGHRDGGKLLAHTYAHLDPKHSAQQIGKVKHAFSASAIAPAQTVTVNGIAYTLEQLAAMLPGKQEADNVIQLRKAAA